MSLTPQQRQTKKARERFLSKFESADARREHMGHLARRSAESRLVLSADEAEALGHAYKLIDRIFQRHASKLDKAIECEADDAT